jgi:primosomal protein N' (replication factor Y)
VCACRFRDASALATVVAMLDETDATGVRPIEAIIGDGPALNAKLLELARWMSAYYCCSIETVMRSLLPQVIRRAEVSWKKQLFVRAARAVEAEELEKLRRRAPRQAELLEAVAKLSAPIPAAELLRQTSLDNTTLRALQKRGFIELREEAVQRDPHADEQFIATTNLTLNDEQAVALAAVGRSDARAGNSAPAPAPWRDRQRQDGDLFTGNSLGARAWQNRDRPGAGDLAHAANGRAFQEPLH